jgi:regulator of cell morphogenesis and NO signaling
MSTDSTREALPRALTVNATIALFPETVEVFNRFGIDACCGGAVPLDEAAQRDGADADALYDALIAKVEGA